MRALIALAGSLIFAPATANELTFLGMPVPDSPQPFSPSFLEKLKPLHATNPALSPDGRKGTVRLV